MDAHPIHMHDVSFEVVHRQALTVTEMRDTNAMVSLAPGSAPVAPPPWEHGRKETVISYPGQGIRIRVQSTRWAGSSGTGT